MTRAARKFIDPETGKPSDRDWLDYEVELYITVKGMREIITERRLEETPRSEREVYNKFAPTTGGGYFYKTRPSWKKKPRKIKRQMLAACLRRLIAVGKIKVTVESYPNNKSMHGMVRRNMKAAASLFGREHDGSIRSYVRSNVLEAMADALRAAD